LDKKTDLARVFQILIAVIGNPSPFAFGADHAQEAFPASFIFKNVMVPMRDGTRLATDIYVPSNDGAVPAPRRFPVLLLRTPYRKTYYSDRRVASVASVGTLSPDLANSHGYVIAYRDMRGTFDSEGVLNAR
jgi:predicted acyl esterase